MNTLELFNLLRQMPVFGGLSESTLAFMLERSPVVTIEAGELFFAEGDAAQSLFVIRQGKIVVEKDWHGSPINLMHLSVGDCFGEMAIIDLQPRSASVRATDDCQAIEVTRLTLHELYRTDMEQYAIIMMNMGREVSRRLRTASDRLFELDQSMSK